VSDDIHEEVRRLENDAFDEQRLKESAEKVHEDLNN
jgi:hypothetical protein